MEQQPGVRQLVERLDPQGAPRIVLVRRAPQGIRRAGQRLGVFSAAFNPLHNAHVKMIEEAHRLIPFDEALLLLAKANVDKGVLSQSEGGAAMEQRLMMMLRLAEKRPTFSVAAVSHGRFADKATALREVYPQGTEIHFILGFDTLVRLFDPKYYGDMGAELQRLFDAAQFIAANRGGHDLGEMRQLLSQPACQPFADRVRFIALDDLHAHISSTEVRRRVRAGEVWEHLVPAEVERFMRESGLYR